MLYSEIIAVCSEIHTKYINTMCGQNVELLNVKLVVHKVTAGLWRVGSTVTGNDWGKPRYTTVIIAGNRPKPHPWYKLKFEALMVQSIDGGFQVLSKDGIRCLHWPV